MPPKHPSTTSLSSAISRIYRIAILLVVILSETAQQSVAANVAPADTSRTTPRCIQSALPKVSGTIRTKYEWQPQEHQSRFEVRTARVALAGQALDLVDYKAEIDLSDEGQIKMLDAYAALSPITGLNIRLGQMRVPFSIDAHRSPHKQHFANRSFLAKQVGNVRDVGLYLAYRPAIPITIEGGVFNGSGLTNQKNFWTSQFNYSVKLQTQLPIGLTLETSLQAVSPQNNKIHLYDVGLTFTRGPWFVECEYTHKHYTHQAFPDVNAVNAMAAYTLPLRRLFTHLQFLCRYDYMDNHSDGLTWQTSTVANSSPVLALTDAQRSRLTAGLTLRLSHRIQTDLRLNYEKYFYHEPELAKPSERDKAVAELVVHF